MKKENVATVAHTLSATFAAMQAIIPTAAITRAVTFAMKPPMITNMSLERRFYNA